MTDRTVDVTHSWKAEQWDWPLQQNDGVVRLTNTNEKFEVALDAAFFTPKEIEVNCLFTSFETSLYAIL